jgi:hypothetical protein
LFRCQWHTLPEKLGAESAQECGKRLRDWLMTRFVFKKKKNRTFKVLTNLQVNNKSTNGCRNMVLFHGYEPDDRRWESMHEKNKEVNVSKEGQFLWENVKNTKKEILRFTNG